MPVGNGSCHSTAAERDISRGLVAAWTAMAADGDPSTHGRKWPRFDECDPHGMLVQDQSMAVAALDYAECDFWDQVWAELGGVSISVPSREKCSLLLHEAHVAEGSKTPKAASASRPTAGASGWLMFCVGVSIVGSYLQ